MQHPDYGLRQRSSNSLKRSDPGLHWVRRARRSDNATTPSRYPRYRPRRLGLPEFWNDPARTRPGVSGLWTVPAVAEPRVQPVDPGDAMGQPRTPPGGDAATQAQRRYDCPAGLLQVRSQYPPVRHRHPVPPHKDPHLIGGARAGSRSNRGFPVRACCRPRGRACLAELTRGDRVERVLLHRGGSRPARTATRAPLSTVFQPSEV